MTNIKTTIVFAAITSSLAYNVNSIHANGNILCSSELFDSENSANLAGSPGKFWNNGSTLNVYFLDGDEDFIKKVSDIANEWAKNANLKFNFYLPGNAPPQSHIRVTFKGGAYQSYVGQDSLYNRGIYGETMQLGNNLQQHGDDEIKRVVLHEFGHAIGLKHEHQNPSGTIQWNENAVYDYYAAPPNNWPRDKTYRNVLAKLEAGTTNYSEYDKFSIMVYDFPASFTLNGFSQEPNFSLSDTDKKFISKWYPPAEVPWDAIGHAHNIAAITAINGKLFAATKDNRLWWRDPVAGDNIGWEPIGHAYNIAAMAAIDGKLFAATKDNRLWRRDPVAGDNIGWEPIGHAHNIAAMTASNGKLFAATKDNRLWWRDPVAGDSIGWEPIGHAHNVIGMTAINGKLFAATSDNRLWWRDPVR